MIDKLKRWIKLLSLDGNNTKRTVMEEMIKLLDKMESDE